LLQTARRRSSDRAHHGHARQSRLAVEELASHHGLSLGRLAAGQPGQEQSVVDDEVHQPTMRRLLVGEVGILLANAGSRSVIGAVPKETHDRGALGGSEWRDIFPRRWRLVPARRAISCRTRATTAGNSPLTSSGSVATQSTIRRPAAPGTRTYCQSRARQPLATGFGRRVLADRPIARSAGYLERVHSGRDDVVLYARTSPVPVTERALGRARALEAVALVGRRVTRPRSGREYRSRPDQASAGYAMAITTVGLLWSSV
jgi:hypothetical protein